MDSGTGAAAWRSRAVCGTENGWCRAAPRRAEPAPCSSRSASRAGARGRRQRSAPSKALTPCPASSPPRPCLQSHSRLPVLRVAAKPRAPAVRARLPLAPRARDQPQSVGRRRRARARRCPGSLCRALRSPATRGRRGALRPDAHGRVRPHVVGGVAEGAPRAAGRHGRRRPGGEGGVGGAGGGIGEEDTDEGRAEAVVGARGGHGGPLHRRAPRVGTAVRGDRHGEVHAHGLPQVRPRGHDAAARWYFYSCIANNHKMKREEGLWELARRCHDAYSKAKNNKKHLTDIPDLNFLLCRAIQNPQLTPAVGSVVEEPTTFDMSDLESKASVEDYVCCGTVHGIGPSIALLDSIKDGELDCACMYPSPLHSRKQIQEVLDKVKGSKPK